MWYKKLPFKLLKLLNRRCSCMWSRVIVMEYSPKTATYLKVSWWIWPIDANNINTFLWRKLVLDVGFLYFFNLQPLSFVTIFYFSSPITVVFKRGSCLWTFSNWFINVSEQFNVMNLTSHPTMSTFKVASASCMNSELKLMVLSDVDDFSALIFPSQNQENSFKRSLYFSCTFLISAAATFATFRQKIQNISSVLLHSMQDICLQCEISGNKKNYEHGNKIMHTNSWTDIETWVNYSILSLKINVKNLDEFL